MGNRGSLVGLREMPQTSIHPPLITTVKILEKAGCKWYYIRINPSRNNANRDYVNVWTTCRNAEKLLKGR